VCCGRTGQQYKENELATEKVIDQTVTGFGFDLVEIQRSAGGLLRVTIDYPWEPNDPIASDRRITVEDCEKVTRQLQFSLEVEGVQYSRLEVSSPGIDRPLRCVKDYERFVGSVIDLTLREPIGLAAHGQVSALRKKFRGTLERLDGEVESVGLAENHQWQIVWSDAPAVKPGVRVSKKRAPQALQVLGFRLDEVREARLAPIVNFKGRNNLPQNS